MEVKLPTLTEEVHEATISYWHHEVGAKVEEGTDLVEMATDKATFNLPSPCAGTLTKILLEEGDTVKVGDTVAIIE